MDQDIRNRENQLRQREKAIRRRNTIIVALIIVTLVLWLLFIFRIIVALAPVILSVLVVLLILRGIRVAYINRKADREMFSDFYTKRQGGDMNDFGQDAHAGDGDYIEVQAIDVSEDEAPKDNGGSNMRGDNEFSARSDIKSSNESVSKKSASNKNKVFDFQAELSKENEEIKSQTTSRATGKLQADETQENTDTADKEKTNEISGANVASDARDTNGTTASNIASDTNESAENFFGHVDTSSQVDIPPAGSIEDIYENRASYRKYLSPNLTVSGLTFDYSEHRYDENAAEVKMTDVSRTENFSIEEVVSKRIY